LKRSFFSVAATLSLAAGTACAQQTPPAAPAMPPMAGMPGMAKMTGMSDRMSMSSSVDLLSPMSQEASGTAWLPQSSPMYGKMIMRANGDMLMVHGAIMPRFVSAGGARGDRRVDAPNWAMGMYSHPLGANDQLGLRTMVSLDPLTEGGYGYPLLFQTGETWHGRPLHDRQHPHDLFSELSADYSHRFAPKASAYLYAAYPGEPALGPPTYMHRLIAYDLPDAPIGHHWQDATHITFGVATAGLNLANRVKFESSVFTGREPNENRYNFDPAHFDSGSGRISYNPNANDALQISYGYIKNPEGDRVDQHRVTASWIYNRPLGDDANFTTSLVWGQNIVAGEDRANSYLAEADYQVGRNSYFTRLERIQKSTAELVLPAAAGPGLHELGAYTIGYLRDIRHGSGIDTGIGGAITFDSKRRELDPFYGSGVPVGFQVMLRLRPSREKMAGMSRMTMPAPSADPSAGAISATITPDPPVARRPARLVMTIKDADGKPLTGAAVVGSLSMVEMDMGTRQVVFSEQVDGRYAADVAFAMPGAWSVKVTAQPAGQKEDKMLVRTLPFTVTR
jgi:hypothetical protein